jgi:hypothetical protein
MNHQIILSAFARAGAVAAACLLLLAAPGRASEEEVEGFVEMMGGMQKFMHKAGLSLREGNFELADFYLHEIEEILEQVEKVESYKGHLIGDLTEEMLTPSFHKLEEAVDGKGRDAALTAFAAVIDSCNRCHTAAAHGFIKIQDRSDNNPYMQDFGK